MRNDFNDFDKRVEGHITNIWRGAFVLMLVNVLIFLGVIVGAAMFLSWAAPHCERILAKIEK